MLQCSGMKRKVIEQHVVYNASEASQLLGVDKRTLYNLFENGEIQAKQIGKGWKVLGENLLSAMGSVTLDKVHYTNDENNIRTDGVPTVK